MSNRARPAIRTVIAQHDALMRDLLAASLRSVGWIDLVAQYPAGPALLREVRQTRPEVAVLDLDLGAQNGVQVATRLQRIAPDVGVVLLVMPRDVAVLTALTADGLSNWLYVVNKGAHGLTTLLRAIQITHARLLNLGTASEAVVRRRATSVDPAAPTITARQRQVLELVADGFTNRAIGEMLGVREKTVENQLSALYGRVHPGAERTRRHPRVALARWYLETVGGMRRRSDD